MGTTDFDPCLVDLCRQLDSGGEEDDCSNLADGNAIQRNLSLSLNSLPLSEYTPEELMVLSHSLGRSGLGHIEIEGVAGLDWKAILNQENCRLNELSVTLQSPCSLKHLVKSLCHNKSLKTLELGYYDSEDDSEEENENDLGNVDGESSCDELSSEISQLTPAIHKLFFEALMPLRNVVLRGIAPTRLPFAKSSESIHRPMECSLRHLTIEECDITGNNSIWLTSCITSLEDLVIRNCQLSGETIKLISDAYLTETTQRHNNSERGPSHGHRRHRDVRRKSPLRVLDLSNNDWSLSFDDDSYTIEKESIGYVEKKMAMPSPSCTSLVASWLDSLSNLVELNLSNNPYIFNGNPERNFRGMVDLCGTVNQSLKRLSVRSCQLIPNDLHQLVNTFCWLEALDLSENPELTSDLTPLVQLEHLTELVLENMMGSTANETFEFERLLCDEDFDIETMDQGLTNLLVEMWNRENEDFAVGYSRTRIQGHRRKPLGRLNLSGNILSKQTLEILSMFDSLKVLILMGCQVGADGVRELFSGISDSQWRSPLRELYLASNTIGDVGALVLARNLREQYLSQLKVLDIGSNVISVEAFRVLVEDGLMHSKRLESLDVSSDGAITRNQQEAWYGLEQTMEHTLLLNQAGQFTLYMDGCESLDTREDEEISIDGIYGNETSFCTSGKNISASVWPFILEDADSIYGPDALFHFLHKRPDLILSPQHSLRSSDLQASTPIKSTAYVTSSPAGVTEIAQL